MDPGSTAAPRGGLVLKVHDPIPILFGQRGWFEIFRERIELLVVAVYSVLTGWPGAIGLLLLSALVILADRMEGNAARRRTSLRHIVVDESEVTWPFAHGDEILPRPGVRFSIERRADAPLASWAGRLRIKGPHLDQSIFLSQIDNLVKPVMFDPDHPDTPENRERIRGERRDWLELLDVEQIRERLSADEVIVPTPWSAKIPAWAHWVVAVCVFAPVFWLLLAHARHLAFPGLVAFCVVENLDGLGRWARRLWTRWNVRRAQALSPAA